MNIYRIVNEPCEICLKEYIHNESAKLAHMPENQEKTRKIHKIIEDAQKEVKSVSILLTCDASFDKYNTHHRYCEKHLYEMIDAIKEYEDDCNDPSLS